MYCVCSKVSNIREQTPKAPLHRLLIVQGAAKQSMLEALVGAHRLQLWSNRHQHLVVIFVAVEGTQIGEALTTSARWVGLQAQHHRVDQSVHLKFIKLNLKHTFTKINYKISQNCSSMMLHKIKTYYKLTRCRASSCCWSLIVLTLTWTVLQRQAIRSMYSSTSFLSTENNYCIKTQ